MALSISSVANVSSGKKSGSIVDMVRSVARNHKLDWKLVIAVAVIESNFNPHAKSKDGKDHGLMQIRKVHLKGTGLPIAALYNSKVNLQIGCKYLSYLIKKHGLDGGIQAYNIGERKYAKGTRSRSYLYKVKNVYRGIEIVSPGPFR